MLGIGIVFPATHPFFLHPINISNDQTLILDMSYYWKKKKKNSRRPILKMHQHALLMQGMALAVPDSGCDSSCFTELQHHVSLYEVIGIKMLPIDILSGILLIVYCVKLLCHRLLCRPFRTLVTDTARKCFNYVPSSSSSIGTVTVSSRAFLRWSLLSLNWS